MDYLWLRCEMKEESADMTLVFVIMSFQGGCSRIMNMGTQQLKAVVFINNFYINFSVATEMIATAHRRSNYAA